MKTMRLHALIKSVYMVSVQLSLMLYIITILKGNQPLFVDYISVLEPGTKSDQDLFPRAFV